MSFTLQPIAAAAPDRAANPQLAQLAQQFLGAYQSALGSQNAQQLGALYGADSVLCLDGQVAEGAANIAAQVIAPRLAAAPIQVRVARCDAQLIKSTGQVLLFVTGEASASPPGRFSQVFVLQPIAAGGMYIRVDIQRFGAGALAHNLSRDPAGTSGSFLQLYYQALAANKASLGGAFRDSSEMTFEGEHFRGQKEILAKLGGTDGAKPVPDGARDVTTVDAVPLGGGALLAFVTGSITLQGELNKLAFAQAFVLASDASGSFCADDLFQFHYG